MARKRARAPAPEDVDVRETAEAKRPRAEPVQPQAARANDAAAGPALVNDRREIMADVARR